VFAWTLLGAISATQLEVSSVIIESIAVWRSYVKGQKNQDTTTNDAISMSCSLHQLFQEAKRVPIISFIERSSDPANNW